jgi:hypothetical protein
MVIKNKKGIFFTVLALLIISLFLLSYTLYTGVHERKTAQKRVETMNNFLLSLEQDLERQIFTSGFRVILIFEQRISQTGDYINENDFNELFSEVFLEGEFYDESTPEMDILMAGATFDDILALMQSKGNKLNLDIDMTNQAISADQDDPWHVKVQFNTNFQMKDKAGLAEWNKNLQIISYIPITHFNDPIYTVNTNRKLTNKITETTFTDFPNDFIEHAQASYYIVSTNEAPSFLQRLTGNIDSTSSNGIESIVNLQTLSSTGIPISQDKTAVDHDYFSDEIPIDPPCQVTGGGAPSWLIIDSPHATTTYNNVPCTPI